jgi:hypothetical protein
MRFSATIFADISKKPMLMHVVSLIAVKKLNFEIKKNA